MSGTGKTWQVKGMIKWLVYGCEVWEVLDDNFDQSDECCFSDWGWLKNQLPERSALWHIFSTEGIKWNYSKLFEPHTSSISTFCKISPHLHHFPITTGIWPIHTVPSSSLARHRRDASSRDLLPAVARSHCYRSRSCLPPRQEVGQTTGTVTLV